MEKIVSAWQLHVSPSVSLPVEPVLPALRTALAEHGSAVLQAPPGAGKTTLVPLALLDEAWARGKIVMLEPRRHAARGAASRMAALRGEAVGETVGYRMRLDTRIGPRTRIEVVTEGILVRMLQRDPSLDGVAALIFDEFHERSLDADLGLALALEAKRALRDDLRLLVMSATLDGDRVAALLGGVPVVASEGRSFPVETIHVDPAPWARIEDAIAATIGRALRETDGDVLAFLPGGPEIRRVAGLLERQALGPEIDVLPLYGDLAQAAQDRAIRPAPPGRRKVVLATAIAETSLTIEGVRAVVDSGLARVPRFEPRSGMTRLATVRLSQASADQRRGRAGRVAAGTCYRLWTEASHRVLARFSRPEILDADLAPLALELAEWGVADPGALAFLDTPPAPALAQARALLAELGALDAAGRVTPHGKAIASFGAHPRLAHMMVAAGEQGLGVLACDIAALLSGRDLLRGTARDSDLGHRLTLLRSEGGEVDRFARRQAQEQARLWRRQLGAAPGDDSVATAGRVLALAYPDRIAQRRPGGEPHFRLANGRGAFLPAADPLAAAPFLAVAELDGERSEARIFLAASLARDEIEDAFGDRVVRRDSVRWDAREEAVVGRRQTRLGELVLEERPLGELPREAVRAAMLDGIRALGIAALPWSGEAEALRARLRFVAREDAAGAWPDVSDAALLAGLEDWLGPYLDGVARRAQLARLDLAEALRTRLAWEQRQRLDRLAPTHLDVPSGSRLALDYAGEAPVLAVKLQEMFGATATPAVLDGRVPVVLHLLSPAGRPLQVTRDLAGFWATSYRAVRSEMRGRYPRHPWPDDPLTAAPTRRAKPRTG